MLGFLLAWSALFNVKFPPFSTECCSYNTFSLVLNCCLFLLQFYIYLWTDLYLHCEYSLLLHKLLLYFCHISFFFLLIWEDSVSKPLGQCLSFWMDSENAEHYRFWHGSKSLKKVVRHSRYRELLHQKSWENTRHMRQKKVMPSGKQWKSIVRRLEIVVK